MDGILNEDQMLRVMAHCKVRLRECGIKGMGVLDLSLLECLLDLCVID